ncbi:MAG: aminopeptidase P family protein [Actinomycetia bacterium]|nr:aminopeptidase P family protein [Actinomycetes bacterium]
MSVFVDRLDRVRATMTEQGVDATLLSVGADLPWLTGYEATPLERLTMLVVPRDGDAVMFVPELEVPRVHPHPEVFSIVGWSETEDPVALVAKQIAGARRAVIGDTTWARFLVDLIGQLPGTTFGRASEVVGSLRAVKDAHEVDCLRVAAHVVDAIAHELQTGAIPLIGRTEADVSAELGRRIIDGGHHRVNFAIVASGPNSASPHHHASDKVIGPDEVVLCDFGGTMSAPGEPGYCSDITRCVYTGEPPTEFTALYDALFAAQDKARLGALVGHTGAEVDGIARDGLTEAGYGEYFIHRLGHGIGVEEHEAPYLVASNHEAIEVGNAFSIEPGIYVPHTWGARLEDIVVAAADGPDVLNQAARELFVVEA